MPSKGVLYAGVPLRNADGNPVYYDGDGSVPAACCCPNVPCCCDGTFCDMAPPAGSRVCGDVKAEIISINCEGCFTAPGITITPMVFDGTNCWSKAALVECAGEFTRIDLCCEPEIEPCLWSLSLDCGGATFSGYSVPTSCDPLVVLFEAVAVGSTCCPLLGPTTPGYITVAITPA